MADDGRLGTRIMTMMSCHERRMEDFQSRARLCTVRLAIREAMVIYTMTL